jgi:ketosteroid isomerase-like protein
MGCSGTGNEPLSSSELETIKAADHAYATAWLTNDSEQVMATLTEDAVLLPSGIPVIEGAEEIRRFWWPGGAPPTNVTEFTLVQREVGGRGDIGFVRGSFSLAFEYDGTAYSGRGEYLSLLKRGSDATWRISHRMWSDRPPETDD